MKGKCEHRQMKVRPRKIKIQKITLRKERILTRLNMKMTPLMKTEAKWWRLRV